jgi:hypothetical protein
MLPTLLFLTLTTLTLLPLLWHLTLTTRVPGAKLLGQQQLHILNRDNRA